MKGGYTSAIEVLVERLAVVSGLTAVITVDASVYQRLLQGGLGLGRIESVRYFWTRNTLAGQSTTFFIQDGVR